MKSYIRAEHGKRNIVLSGKGSEYSAVANEVTDYLDGWISASGLSERELRNSLSHGSFRIEEDTVSGNKSIVLICNEDQSRIGEPFIWSLDVMPLSEFRVTVSLILLSLSKRYGSSAVEDAARKYAKGLDK